MSNNTLRHYGIFGMKWGVRRSPTQLASVRGASMENSSYTSKKDRKGTVRSMSDDELRQRINRLQMEKQYSQLTHREKSVGERFITNVLASAAQQTASKYVSQYMSKGVDAIIKNITSK